MSAIHSESKTISPPFETQDEQRWGIIQLSARDSRPSPEISDVWCANKSLSDLSTSCSGSGSDCGRNAPASREGRDSLAVLARAVFRVTDVVAIAGRGRDLNCDHFARVARLFSSSNLSTVVHADTEFRGAMKRAAKGVCVGKKRRGRDLNSRVRMDSRFRIYRLGQARLPRLTTLSATTTVKDSDVTALRRFEPP